MARLQKLENSLPGVSLVGWVLHEDGEPTEHEFKPGPVTAQWFATGELPANLSTVMILVTSRAEIAESAHEFGYPSEVDSYHWQTFPSDLHPKARADLRRVVKRGIALWGGNMPLSDLFKETHP